MELNTISPIGTEGSFSCDKKSSGIFEKVKKILKNITIEPYLLLYIIPVSISYIADQNLNLEKACRINKNFTSTICDNVMQQNQSEGSFEEIEIQSLVSKMNAWRSPIESIPAILVIFIGAWSDKKRRRKPCLLLPIIGEIISAIGLIFCVYYFLEWPMEVSGLIEVIPQALTGGTVTMMMSIFTYISDVSSPKERTFRIGLLNVVMTICFPTGMALSGILLKQFGYYGVFSIALALMLCGVAYVIFVVKEKHVDGEKLKGEEGSSSLLVLLKETIGVLFKKRKGNKQKQLLFILLTYCVCNGPIGGSYSLFYMYMRRRFLFDEVKYSIFSTYSTVIELIGMLLTLSILSKKLQIADSLLGALGIFMTIIAKCIYALSPTVAWLCLAPIPESIQGVIFVSLRSMSSKVVEEDEIGKVISLIGMLDGILMLFYKPMLATVYVHTISVFPGAYFLVVSAIMFPSLFIFLYIYKIQKYDKENESDLEKDIEESVPLKPVK